MADEFNFDDEKPLPPPPPSYDSLVLSNQEWPVEKTRRGTLAGLLIVQWIHFGFLTFGLLSVLSYFILGFSWLLILGTLVIQIAMSITCFISALGITKYKKYGITFGWISVYVYAIGTFLFSLMSIFFANNFYTQFLPKGSSVNSSNDDLLSFFKLMPYLSAVSSICFSLLWIIPKVYLLRAQSTKEQVRRYFD